MSYEGYEIQYCNNGHRVTSYDAHYTTPEKSCPICGCEEFTYDSVDQTNGCCCNVPEYKCYAHAQELQVVKFDKLDCPDCGGSGFIPASNSFCVKSCICRGNPDCESCYGTNTVYTQYRGSTVSVLCSKCEGRGTAFVPVFDLTPLHDEENDESRQTSEC